MTEPQYLDQWTQHMQAQGLAVNTVTSRRFTITKMATHLDPVTATTADLLAWLSAQPWTSSTRSTHRSTLMAFFTWLQAAGHRADNPMDGVPSVRRPVGVPRPISNDDLARYLSVAKRPLRDWAVLAAYAGLRCAEIAVVKHDDIDGDKLRVTGKGGGIAYVPLSTPVLDCAATWPKVGWAFPRKPGSVEHILAKQVSERLGRDLTLKGINATAHQLRHSFGTNVLRASGGNVRTAQKALRHSSINSTAIYTRVDDSAVRDAISNIDYSRRNSSAT